MMDKFTLHLNFMAVKNELESRYKSWQGGEDEKCRYGIQKYLKKHTFKG